MKKPDYHLEARKNPGMNNFDVTIRDSNKEHGTTPKTDTKQMTLSELQHQIDSSLKEHPTGSTFSALLPPSLPTERNRMEIEGGAHGS